MRTKRFRNIDIDISTLIGIDSQIKLRMYCAQFIRGTPLWIETNRGFFE